MPFEIFQQDGAWVAQGHDPNFHPGNMPPPTRALLINPHGYDDAEAEPDMDDMLAYDFEAHNVDALFVLVQGSLEDFEQEIFSHALKFDVSEHLIEDGGGLYALWQLPDNYVLVAGMGNGGSECAEHTISTWVEDYPCVARMNKAHFYAEAYLGPQATESNQLFDMCAALWEKQRIEDALPSLAAPSALAKKM